MVTTSMYLMHWRWHSHETCAGTSVGRWNAQRICASRESRSRHAGSASVSHASPVRPKGHLQARPASRPRQMPVRTGSALQFDQQQRASPPAGTPCNGDGLPSRCLAFQCGNARELRSEHLVRRRPEMHDLCLHTISPENLHTDRSSCLCSRGVRTHDERSAGRTFARSCMGGWGRQCIVGVRNN